MIAFPNAKINIGLSVINKRTDGYHNLKSLFYPIPLYDALEIIVNKNINSPIIKTYGNNINCAPEDNICIKAFNVLKEKYDIPFVEIYLYKSIPHGAGLGGGSSNGASMIVMLNNTFNLNLNEKEMIELASTVGSDCPFFIYNRPMLAEGRGEVLSPFSIDLSGNFLVLIKPTFDISTKLAYSLLKPSGEESNLEQKLLLPINEWKNNIFNDFEDVIFKEYLELQKIKDTLYSIGSTYTSMSGSGSTIYGIFSSPPDSKEIDRYFKNYYYKILKL